MKCETSEVIINTLHLELDPDECRKLCAWLQYWRDEQVKHGIATPPQNVTDVIEATKQLLDK